MDQKQEAAENSKPIAEKKDGTRSPGLEAKTSGSNSEGKNLVSSAMSCQNILAPPPPPKTTLVWGEEGGPVYLVPQTTYGCQNWSPLVKTSLPSGTNFLCVFANNHGVASAVYRPRR